MIKRIIERYFPLLAALVILVWLMLPSSCANTTDAPTGGKKDTIPPVIVGLSPLPGAVNVPTKDLKIYITFDEYVKVKDPKGIFLSPPQSKSPKFKMRNKTLIVYFEEDLQENTTYTLDLTGAVVDNNESNPYPGFTLHFSTGEKIDNYVVTGTVYDCNTLLPLSGATVMLYKDHSDSAIFKSRPVAAMKTDEWGYFALRNVADTLYRIYAITDDLGNNIYDPDTDLIAFDDSLFRPVMTVTDSLPELLKYDMKDTLNCLARKSEHELFMFRDKPGKQMIKDSKRIDKRSAYISFFAPEAKIDSLWVRGFAANRLITQFNQSRDSLELWINDRKKMPDTLHVFVDYLKSDSSGAESPFTEHLRLTAENAKGKSKSSYQDLKHNDTICELKVSAAADRVEQYGFELEFKYPIINEGFKQTTLTSVNPRQQQSQMDYEISRDSLNLRKYTLMPKEKLQGGYEYILKIPHRQFRDINGFYNDSTEVKVSLPNDDKLSSLTLKLGNVRNNYIVDLLNENRSSIIRSYNINKDTELLFPYLKNGKYSIRITEDINCNGVVDTGNLSLLKQPEKARLFKLKGGNYIITIPEGTEIVQNIDIEELFKN